MFTHQNKLPLIIFFLFIFFIPQQFGPHFWPISSYVKGIRIDYLSPTLYISDVLILLLFLTSFKKVFSHKQARSFLFSKPFVLFVIILCIPLLYSESPANLFYGLFSLVKFLYVGLFTAIILKKEHIKIVILIFLLTATLESLLSVFQFFTQGSLGGMLYFLGERTMVLSTIGAAAMNTSYGLVLRPYGTFSHPNVLGFYLLTSFLFGIYALKSIQDIRVKFLTALSLSIIQIGILLSFSRIVILQYLITLAVVGLLYGNVKNFRKHMVILSITLASLGAFLVFFSNRFSNFYQLSSAILPRVDLIRINFEIFKMYPFFGTGLQNYLFAQVDFQKNFSSIYLQPVHNIYLLLLIQIGLAGFGIVMYFFYLTYIQLKSRLPKHNTQLTLTVILLLQFSSLLWIGFFDHYLLTIQQAQLVFALILGLCWNTVIITDSELE